MASPPDHLSFETVPTRAFARVDDHLFVVNPQAYTVEAFRVLSDGTLQPRSPIPVGMEPIALAVSDEGELWVVNHLSDSISIIDIGLTPARVTRTLLVGDEPRDIVMANGRAFITTARRGQHRSHPSLAGVPGSGGPETHSPSTPRADVWVFDTAAPGPGLGGTPLAIVELFGDTPRALAATPDGSSVFAAVFHSGNQTSVVHEGVMCYGFMDDPAGRWWSGREPCTVKDGIISPSGLADGQLPGGRPAPGTNAEGEPQPWTSMIVRYDRSDEQWKGPLGRNFSNGIRFHLPDLDVFRIDTVTLQQTDQFPHVGTTLFNLAVNPRSGQVYVTNTEAQNHVRFEGPGIHGETTVQGNIAQTRITVIDPGTGAVRPRHLNPHIDYGVLKAPAAVRAHSLATPLQMAIANDGETLYAAMLGSDRIAVFPTSRLEEDAAWSTFDPVQASSRHLEVAGGPIGLVLNEPRRLAYVMTWFDHAIAVIDLDSGEERQRIAMPNPESERVRAGRRMLYDARLSSSNGEASCAGCHTFGDVDHLAWDLGNPDAPNTANPNPQPTRNLTELSCDLLGRRDPGCQFLRYVNGNGDLDSFAAMKGPMTTQTLRGISTHGHMHWRADRANGYFGIDTDQTLDERLSFMNFIVAFEGLLGLDVDLSGGVDAPNKSAARIELERSMERFTNFALALHLPPNPHKGLDGRHSPSGAIGRAFFNGQRRSDGSETDYGFNGPEPDGVNCAGCHTLDPARGFYGSDGTVAHGGEILMLKVPSLRNLYQRVGMFGLPDREGFLPSSTREHQGDQVRGFGFLHDGATDRLFNFLQGSVFDNGELPCPEGLDSSHGCDLNFGAIGIPDDETRLAIVDYLMEFDSDLAPVVGQQITVGPGAGDETLGRWALLEERAGTPFTSYVLGGETRECDLVARAVAQGLSRGYLYRPETNDYLTDRQAEPPIAREELERRARTGDISPVTFTCVPPGSGHRVALDADRNGVLDGDQSSNREQGVLRGTWFEPGTAGQGVLFAADAARQRLAAAWFTFTPDGAPTWYTAEGSSDGQHGSLTVFETLGGRFNDPLTPQTRAIGDLELTLEGCDQLLARYRFDDGRAGILNLQPVGPDISPACQAAPDPGTADGAWFNPATTGQGLFLDAFRRGGEDLLFAGWFTFGVEAESGLRWLTLHGAANNDTEPLIVYETTGGFFNTPGPVDTIPVGTAELELAGCGQAQLRFTLEAESLSGTIPLTRLLPTPCVPATD